MNVLGIFSTLTIQGMIEVKSARKRHRGSTDRVKEFKGENESDYQGDTTHHK